MPKAADGSGSRLCGTVVRGDARGRTIGFPTANIAVGEDATRQLPRGVYAAVAHLAGARYGAVVNIGQRPTFGTAHVTVEVHLLDFAGEIYGAQLEVELAARLRDERRFETVAELVAQVEEDVSKARIVLAGPGSGPL